MKKWWEDRAVGLLEQSLDRLPQELNELDWKITISENGEKVAKHLSAMANYSEGGFLVFGVSNSGKKIGLSLEDCQEIQKKIGNIIRDGLEPALVAEAAVIKVGKENLLFVFIPESETKPVHLRGRGIYESYIRSAGQTRKLKPQEVARIMTNSTSLTFERKHATPALSMPEVLRRLDFITYFRLISQPIPSDPQDIIEALMQERLVKRTSDSFHITNLGAILLAKDLNEFDDLKRRAVRVIQYKGKDRLKRVKEYVGKKGYASGFQALIEFINRMLPSNEIIKDALRKEVRLYPELSIRELVANALMMGTPKLGVVF